MSTPVNCTDSELSIYLAGLAEGYCPTYYSYTNPSAPLRLNPIASKSYTHGKKTVSFLGFPSLTMLKHSTESRGADLSKSSRVDFLARTFPPQEKAKESKGNEVDCGEKWQEWFAKLDPDTSSWKIRQCSLFADLDESLETWPRWGMMRNGVCLELPTLELHIYENESGFWPTPCLPGNGGTNGKAKMKAMLWHTPDTCGGGTGPSQLKRNQPRLQDAVKWATPNARDWKEQTLSPALARAHANMDKSRQLPRQMSALCPNLHGGQLNPTWVEWLMGWQLGWTDLKPLATDKCHSAPHSLGKSFPAWIDINTKALETCFQYDTGRKETKK
jgi:hypothetical protein